MYDDSLSYYISIHAPTRGATYKRLQLYFYKLYFNPRSHERSDENENGDIVWGTKISIHAPTRGATETQALTNDIKAISIHAPTRGATTYDIHYTKS